MITRFVSLRMSRFQTWVELTLDLPQKDQKARLDLFQPRAPRDMACIAVQATINKVTGTFRLQRGDLVVYTKSLDEIDVVSGLEQLLKENDPTRDTDDD